MKRPHIVIVGGGLVDSCSKALRTANVDVTVLDRTNHTSFSRFSIRSRPPDFRLTTSLLRFGTSAAVKAIRPCSSRK